jgi:hypothetical protein
VRKLRPQIHQQLDHGLKALERTAVGQRHTPQEPCKSRIACVMPQCPRPKARNAPRPIGSLGEKRACAEGIVAPQGFGASARPDPPGQGRSTG